MIKFKLGGIKELSKDLNTRIEKESNKFFNKELSELNKYQLKQITKKYSPAEITSIFLRYRNNPDNIVKKNDYETPYTPYKESFEKKELQDKFKVTKLEHL